MSHQIVRRLMVTSHKFSLRVMRMQVLWWCNVWRMKKVMFLTLGVMPGTTVIIRPKFIVVTAPLQGKVRDPSRSFTTRRQGCIHNPQKVIKSL